MFTEGDGEQIVFGQKLGEAAVVRNKRGHNTESTTRLAEAFITLEIGCSRARHGH